jgi:tetratricopeptide (TPR) repeat protein
MDSFPEGGRVYHVGKPSWGEGEVISSDSEHVIIKFVNAGKKKFEKKIALEKKSLTCNYSDLPPEYIEKLPSNLQKIKQEEKQKDNKLRNEFYDHAKKYGLHERLESFQGEQLKTLVNIFIKLERLDRISSLDSESIKWLEDQHIHALLVPIYKERYESKKLPWDLVRLCSSLRKIKNQEIAISYFENESSNIKDKKPLGALFTTIGGSYRDIDEFDKARECGLAAIDISPDSYYPYNLLGGICYSKGNLTQGDHYFEKAVELGADDTAQSNSIKDALHNSSTEDRKAISEHLLNKDPHKFEWVREYSDINFLTDK